eukprot:17882_3
MLAQVVSVRVPMLTCRVGLGEHASHVVELAVASQNAFTASIHGASPRRKSKSWCSSSGTCMSRPGQRSLNVSQPWASRSDWSCFCCIVNLTSLRSTAVLHLSTCTSVSPHTCSQHMSGTHTPSKRVTTSSYFLYCMSL